MEVFASVLLSDLSYQESVTDPLRWPDDHTISWADVYRLFGRYDADAWMRWTSSADSEEYLSIVTYLVHRDNQR